MLIQEPFYTEFLRDKNILSEYTAHDERKLADMSGYFKNEEKRKEIVQEQDPIVYRVYKQEVPLEEGELLHCITIIEPGNVDGEFFMTKGHYHVNEKCAEIYYGQKGKGLLMMQKGDEYRTIEMNPDTIAYIPAGWGHRTINISSEEPFVFFSIWPGQSGYDYQRGIDEPFQKKVYVGDDGYKII